MPIEKSHGQNVGDGMGRISVQGSVSSTTFTPTTAHGVGDYSREITAIRFIVTFPPTIAAMVTDNFTRSGTTWTNTSTNGSAVYTITCTGCRETDDITVDVATVQDGRLTSHNITIRNLTNANVLNGPSRGMVVISSASIASVDNNRALMFDLNPAATAPTLTSLTAMATGRMITWTATFSEPVDGVAMGNFNLSGTRMAQTTATAPMAMSPTNGLSNIWTFTSTTTGNDGGTVIYTFDATPTINNEADVALTEVPTDGSQTATITLAEVDNTAPTTTISGSAGETTITWTITFNEPVMNLAARHFNLSAGTLGTVPTASSGNENTITITSTHTHETDGTITLSFDGDNGTGDNAEDAAGNIAADGTGMVTIEVADPNVVPPPPRLLSLRTTRPNPSNQHMLLWTLTFSEPVNAFTATISRQITDINTTITTPMANTNNPNIWTFTTTTPAMSGGQRVMGQIAIMLGTIQTADDQTTIQTRTTYTAFVGGRSETQVNNLYNENVNKTIEQQAQHYIAALPNLSHRLRRAANKNFTANFNSAGNNNLYLQNNNIFKNENAVGIQFWLETTYLEGEATNKASDVLYNYIGADYVFSKNLVLGMLMQFEKSNFQTIASNNIEGNFTSTLESDSIMFGNYLISHIENYNLDIESKVMFGTGESEFNFISANLDNLNNEFETSRLLFSSAISRPIGLAYIFTPRIEYIYFSQTQEAFQATDLVNMAKNKIELNSLKFSIEANNEIEYSNFTLSPSLSIGGVYDSFDDGERTTTTIGGSLEFYNKQNTRLNLGGHYDISTDDENLETFSVNGRLSVRF